MPAKRAKSNALPIDPNLEPPTKKTTRSRRGGPVSYKEGIARAKGLSHVAGLNPQNGLPQQLQDGQTSAPMAQMVAAPTAVDPALENVGLHGMQPPMTLAQQQPSLITQPQLAPKPPTLPTQQRKRFTDPQPDARATSPFSQSQPPDPTTVSSSVANNAGATAFGPDANITQDDGFDDANADANLVNAEADKRRQQLITARAVQAQLNQNEAQEIKVSSSAQENNDGDVFGNTAEEQGEDQDEDVANEDPEDRSFVDAPEAQPHKPPPKSGYADVNFKAKEEEKIRSRGRTPQSRMPWNSGEVDALIDYIARFGCSWAMIKKIDDEGEGSNEKASRSKGDEANKPDDDEGKGPKWLANRSQVNLKDKARNMKMDYLKARVKLPSNFDKIMLDKKAKDKLAALGIEYQQKQVRQPR